jgi:predicted negative regulator of RcsB-dependent stress response
MDVNTFIQIVNGIGFPIAACIAMGVFIVWDKKTRNEQQKTQMEKQEEMYQKLADSVNANTAIIQRLLDRMGE